MSELRENRVKFTRYIARLIDKAFELGYEIALGEGADFLTVKDPTSDHMQGSLHNLGLAQDIALYLPDGTYLTDSNAYRSLGEYWESLDPLLCWGGRFGDGNHFSLKYGGRK